MAERDRTPTALGGAGHLFRAEWIKIAGNRWVTSCLVWVFPVGAIALVVIFSLILSLSSPARTGFREDTLLWTEQAIGAWDVPNNIFGRLVLLGFTAVVFAGEYQWNTWKNTVPRSRRPALILVKFFTLGMFVVTAFVAMSIILAVGMGLLTRIAGADYGPALSQEVVTEFAGDYLRQATLAFTGTLLAACYAALAGMFTRSILGGVLTGFAIAFGEGFSILGLAFIGWLLKMYDLVRVYRYFPFYNLENISSWLREDKALVIEIFEGADRLRFSNSLEVSVLILALWLVGLIAAIMILFQRQDITT